MASRVLQGVLGRVDSAAIDRAVSAVAAIEQAASAVESIDRRTLGEVQRAATGVLPIVAESQRAVADVKPAVTGVKSVVLAVAQLGQWWEAIRASGRRMAEQLQVAFCAINDRLRLAAQTIGSAVGSIADRIIAGVHYLYSISAGRLIERMRSDSTRDLSASADFLALADRTFSQLPQADGDGGSYEARNVMRDSVGALEELVCQVAGTRKFPDGLKKLINRRIITVEQARQIKKPYNRRSVTDGVAHRAAPVSHEVASRTWLEVRASVRLILDAVGIGTGSGARDNSFAHAGRPAVSTATP